MTGLRAVALGGGHGLAASLSALRRVTDDLTAIVTVADDGGSSGRLRRDFGVLPPGDLRMALAALCRDDEWGTTWSQVVQHRFGGDRELAGHTVGNLLIVALWDLLGDTVAGLDWVGRLRLRIGRAGAADGRGPAGYRRGGGGRRPGPAARGDHGPPAGRVRDHRGPGPVHHAGAAGSARGARGGARRAGRGLGRVRPRLVVHQRAAAPAGARALRGPARHGRAPASGAEPRPAAG